MRDREHLATCSPRASPAYINSSAHTEPVASMHLCRARGERSRVHQSRQVNSRSGRGIRQRKYPKELCATTDETDSHLNINIDAPAPV